MNRMTRNILRGAQRAGRSPDGVRLGRTRTLDLDRRGIEYRATAAASSGDPYEVIVRVNGPDVEVHCDCDDFAYTFYPRLSRAYSTAQDIERPEPKGTGPRRAVDHLGCCKHLMAFITKELEV